MLKKIVLFVVFIAGLFLFVKAEGDGFGANPGGAGGDTIVVETSNDLKSYAGSVKPYVIFVKGTIDVGSEVRVTSRKTLSGIDSTSTILGTVNISGGTNNVVVKNLNISNPGSDGITIRQAKYVYITNCTVYDCGDGLIDVTVESDFVTISHCRFYYEQVLVHKFPNLIGADDSNVTDLGKLHVTFHNNWWEKGGSSRMPLVRFGRVHIFNNYNSSAGNNYCNRARIGAEILSEYNYFEGVRDPLSTEQDGKAQSRGNEYVNTIGTIHPGTDEVFVPSYPYTTVSAAEAKERAMRLAGNRATGIEPASHKKETFITWSDQAQIIYGTPLSTVQLSSSAQGNTSAPIYNPPLGSILPEGYQTITVTYPEDENYKAATRTVNIQVVYEYFTLAVNTTNNADLNLIGIAPETPFANGKYTFPKGTVVTLTANSNMLYQFEKWSDGDTSSNKIVTITGHTEITAIYNRKSYIVGWDFNAQGNSNRQADFYSTPDNIGATLQLMHENGTNYSWILYSASSPNLWFGQYAAMIGRARTSAGSYYFQIGFNAKNFRNIRVEASMLGVMTHHMVQNVEYSTDGTNFVKIGQITLENDSAWYQGSFLLPDDANHQSSVSVRFKADKGSTLVSNGIIGTSISNIYVYGEPGTSAHTIMRKNIKEIVSREYYTSHGRKLAYPSIGLNIVVINYSDGSKDVGKVIF